MHFEAMNMNNGHVSLLVVMRVPVWLYHLSPKCHTPLQCPSNLKPMDFNSYSIYHSGTFSSYPWYIDDCD